MKQTYLDHNAATPLRKTVKDAMAPYLDSVWGNPSSTHSHGRSARVAVDDAREVVAELIGADRSEIVFTSGGTEANNTALLGVVDAALEIDKTRNHVVVSAIEHEAVLGAAEYLRQYRGCDISLVLPDADGLIHPDTVADALTDRTSLVSVMHANNETGVLQRTSDIAEICRSHGVLYHTDAVQSVGKVPTRVTDLGCDLLSLSAHKFNGPKGVGALYIRGGTAWIPHLVGGAQERNRRAGTENVAAIVGLAAATRFASENIGSVAALAQLRDDLETRILDEIPDVVVNGRGTPRLPNSLSVSFHGVGGDEIPMALDLEGISVSAGSACASGSFKPSHVLLAMGRSEALARAVVRFSFGFGNDRTDVERVMSVLPDIVARVRDITSK
jgi:cysteine desulfurase